MFPAFKQKGLQSPAQMARCDAKRVAGNNLKVNISMTNHYQFIIIIIFFCLSQRSELIGTLNYDNITVSEYLES